jgi:cell division GTPase FtsZ
MTYDPEKTHGEVKRLEGIDAVSGYISQPDGDVCLEIISVADDDLAKFMEYSPAMLGVTLTGPDSALDALAEDALRKLNESRGEALAKGLAIIVVSGENTTVADIQSMMEKISPLCEADAHIAWGHRIDPAPSGEAKIIAVIPVAR